MTEVYTTIEAIYYLLKHIIKADTLKIVKLLYLADKYHLMKYSRTITNDEYYAMGHGTVGSLVKDVLCINEVVLYENEIQYAQKLFHKIDKYNYIANKDIIINLDYLSETDIEALDFIIQKFGNLSTGELIDYTHKLPEWKKHEKSLNDGLRREKIETNDLFLLINNDFELSREHIEESRTIYSGQY